MSEQPSYSAVLTLTPPSNEPVAVHITLYPSDTLDASGELKALGDCTLAELRMYAEQLEQEVADTYHDITIRSLLVEPEFGVAVDVTADDWLDQVVVISAESPQSPPELDPIAEAVAASEAVEEPEPVVEEVAVEEVVENSAEGEFVEVEELPLPEISISEAEPIHEERTSDSQTSAPHDSTPEIRTAGIIENGRYQSNSTVAIWMDEEPLRKMQAHARSSLRREVAGVMIGPSPEKQPDGRYIVHVRDMIIAKHTEMSGASVTYTPESWRYMNDKLHEMYPDGDMVMVGWYHTHPGFGIFLSNMDLFIHTNFFTQKWHIAYVLDPIGFKSGFFSWDNGQRQVVPYGFPWPDWMNGSW